MINSKITLSKLKIPFFIAFFGMLLTDVSCKPQLAATLLFVGSYTDNKPGNGIHVYAFDESSGKLTLLHEEPDLTDTSFLALAPDGKYLYATMEAPLPEGGRVGAFTIDSVSGKLEFLSAQLAGGRNPVHLSVHPSGSYLVNSNYTDAGISVFKTRPDGGLEAYAQLLNFKDSSVIKGRQDAAHLHSTNFSPDGRFLVGMDLGADKIRTFSFDAAKTQPLDDSAVPDIIVKPGSGPRHFVFHPNGKYAYCAEELNGNIDAYIYNRGILTPLGSYFSYSQQMGSYGTADIHISPDGKFLYASNRGDGEDTISIFSIDTDSGSLALVGYESTRGRHPRSFVIDPSGGWLLVANQFTNNITVFKRDKETGKLTLTGDGVEVGAPASLKMRTYPD